VRASDKRKADHEKATLDRKEERDDKLREEQNLYDAAEEFTQVCSEILLATIDVRAYLTRFATLSLTRPAWTIRTQKPSPRTPRGLPKL